MGIINIHTSYVFIRSKIFGYMKFYGQFFPHKTESITRTMFKMFPGWKWIQSNKMKKCENMLEDGWWMHCKWMMWCNLVKCKCGIEAALMWFDGLVHNLFQCAFSGLDWMLLLLLFVVDFTWNKIVALLWHFSSPLSHVTHRECVFNVHNSVGWVAFACKWNMHVPTKAFTKKRKEKVNKSTKYVEAHARRIHTTAHNEARTLYLSYAQVCSQFI